MNTIIINFLESLQNAGKIKSYEIKELSNQGRANLKVLVNGKTRVNILGNNFHLAYIELLNKILQSVVNSKNIFISKGA